MSTAHAQLRGSAVPPRPAAAPSELDAVRAWLHDNPLQILEYIAAGGYADVPDPAHLQAVAGQEADRLRAFVEGHRSAGGTLFELLATVVAEQQQLAGHPIALQTHAGGVPVQGPAAEALAGAAREALTNVRKHARATRVSVTCRADARATSVVIEDDGIGLDAAAATSGRGLRDSITARLEGVGGGASFLATPGGGATVVLAAHAPIATVAPGRAA